MYYPSYQQAYPNQMSFNSQNYQQPVQNVQPSYNQIPVSNYNTPTVPRPNGLQGKVVDNIETVKSQDILLDGSITYFALADNSAIATKRLLPDGTSELKIFKPVEQPVETVSNYVNNFDVNNYITQDEFKQKIENIENKNLKQMKEDIKQLKRQFEDFLEEKEKK